MYNVYIYMVMTVAMQWWMNFRISNWIFLRSKYYVNVRNWRFQYVCWFMNDFCKPVLNHQVMQNWSFICSIVLIKPEFFLALKSPNTLVKKGFFKVLASNIDSKLVTKLENSSCGWIGDRYRATTIHSVFW